MRKLSLSWVPRLLTIDLKSYSATTTKQGLVLFNRNPLENLDCFITVNYNWIHRNTHIGGKGSVSYGDSSIILINNRHK